MTDIRQTSQFVRFMQDIGWQFEKINSTYIYLRKFPLVGNFAKIPRPRLPINFSAIYNLVRKKRIFQLKIAPMVMNYDKNYRYHQNQLLRNNWKIDCSPFNPTTTIHIDLRQSEQQIFTSFVEAKRRGVRRAMKNGVFVKDSNNIEDFIKIRQKQYFPMGFLIAKEMKALWKNFFPKYTALLLAYQTSSKPLAGILLLFYNKTAYYWYASALPIGKKLFAPTLLVWEAIRVGKKRGCTIFDFEGIYDERFPKASQSWKGFTKFKEGFGGKKIIYLENFTK